MDEGNVTSKSVPMGSSPVVPSPKVQEPQVEQEPETTVSGSDPVQVFKLASSALSKVKKRAPPGVDNSVLDEEVTKLKQQMLKCERIYNGLVMKFVEQMVLDMSSSSEVSIRNHISENITSPLLESLGAVVGKKDPQDNKEPKNVSMGNLSPTQRFLMKMWEGRT